MLAVQKGVFSLAGMSPKSNNMTAKSGVNAADTGKVYYLLMVGTGALTMSETTIDGVGIEKVSSYARKFPVVDDLFCSHSNSMKTFIHTRDANGMSAIYCTSDASSSEFSEFVKKNLPLYGNTVHSYEAPHKTGVELHNPEICGTTHDTPSVFLCTISQTHTFFGGAVITRAICEIIVN